jgi:expansin (peptidoglycan-binding protein)
MERAARHVLLLAAVLSLAAPAAAAIQFGKTFFGDGTYYGSTDGGGNCAINNPLPSIYAGMTPVAINNPQYDGSCGACLIVRGTGAGSGANPISTKPFRAFVSDRCPECQFGDLDLASNGDGRWKVKWEYVPCPRAGRISYKFEGSNPWYVKIQPRGMATPAKKVVVGGVPATFTQDNFWVATKGTGFPATVKVQVTTVGGAYYEDAVTGKSGVVPGGLPKRG